MYASVWRLPRAKSPGDGINAPRTLSARFGTLPGLTVCLLREQPEGTYVTISTFECRDGLVDAYSLIAALAGTGVEVSGAYPHSMTGEVILQRGL